MKTTLNNLFVLLVTVIFFQTAPLAAEEFLCCPDVPADWFSTSPVITGEHGEQWQELQDLQGKLLDSYVATTGQKLVKPDGQISIIINADKKMLTVYNDNQIYVEFPVAVGKYSTPTPIGEWRVVHKSVNWGGGFGSRWLGLNVPWGIYGIHGTNKPYSIGSNASHGCIRMNNLNVEKLYPIIPMGTPVAIISEQYPKYPPGHKKRPLKKGMSGPDVVEMQTALKQLGILWGLADGRYGTSTEIFVKRYQALTGSSITGEFSLDDYEHLQQILEVIKPN